MEPTAPGATIVTWLVTARGRVQGVGLRDACVRRATSAGITGWVRNRMDASVEALLQGSPAQLESMCDWLREGATPARVETLDITPLPPPCPRFDDFTRRATA
jgi:acylphosphatase